MTNGGHAGAPRSPPRAVSLIFQNAIRSILNSPFGRTDSILAPAKYKREKIKIHPYGRILIFSGGPAGARTRDLRIKSPALYQLSYRSRLF